MTFSAQSTGGGRAVLLLDFQENLPMGKGALPTGDTRVISVLKAATRTIDRARRAGEVLLAVGSEMPKHSGWLNVFRRRPPAEDGHAASWIKDLPLDGVTYFLKSSASAFVNPQLEPWLNEQGVETLAICGLNARTSVAATAISAMSLGYKVELVCDAIDCANATSRQRVLAALLARGARIVRSPIWPQDKDSRARAA